MKSTEKLVKFMELKNEFIKKQLKEEGEKKPKGVKQYFTKKDANFLLTLSEIRATSIWNKIILDDSSIPSPRKNLCSGFCPFCILMYDNCPNCFYGKNHGSCNAVEPNDYSFYVVHIEITNEEYREIILKVGK